MFSLFRAIPVLALVAVVGCQAKLTVSKTFKIPDDGEIVKIFEMPAQAGAQTIKVVATVKSGSNIDCFIIPASLVGNEVGTSPNEKKTWEEKGFGFKRDIKSETFTAKVPANTAYKVLVIQSDSAKEKSDIEIKITN